MDDDEALLAGQHDDDIVAGRRLQGTTHKWVKPLAIVALIFGVIFGIYFAGSGPGTEQAAPAPASSEPSTPQVDPAVRQRELEERLATNPDDAIAHVQLGVVFFNTGQIEKAKEHWVRATELKPDTVEAWYNLGFYYLSTNPPDNAASKAAWDKVIELSPDSDEARFVQSHASAAGGTSASPTASARPTATVSPASSAASGVPSTTPTQRK